MPAIKLLTAAVALALTAALAVAQVKSESRSMDFEACVKTIRTMTARIGQAPKNIVETNDMRMVRFRLSDGSVLVTCSRPDRKLVITRSPYR